MRHEIGGWSGVLALTVVMAAVAGCDSLLEVDLPGQVPEGVLDDPGLAVTLVNGVIADFECAYNNYTFGSSAHSDEYIPSSGNLVQRTWSTRNISSSFANYVSGTCSGNGFGLWTTLHTARFQAEDAFERLSSFPDSEVEDKTAKLATVSAYAGYAYTLFGEGFCEVRFDGGPVAQPAASLATADERFTRAIDLAQQAGDQDILNMALVGRARARLDAGDLSGAILDAEQVPDGFVKMAERDGPALSLDRRWNKGFEFFVSTGHHSVAPGFRGLEWKGIPDPRVPVEDAGRLGHDGTTPVWITTKYPERTTDIELATWTEAQLIIAEASTRSGDDARAVAIINDLHVRAGLPPFDPVADVVAGPTANNVLNMVLLERSRELFQEGGHRLNDMLRYDIPFFTGNDPIGQPYGTATCYPFPDVEK
ncbi:MAG: RagB/SusD family nutrient uptake outer membrane protein [Gemmatimonadota bacterium]